MVSDVQTDWGRISPNMLYVSFECGNYVHMFPDEGIKLGFYHEEAQRMQDQTSKGPGKKQCIK
jgi:hypothetical protein